jgi:CelD/BcsL family acetyltransferase involved in cellulose biosynthesis
MSGYASGVMKELLREERGHTSIAAPVGLPSLHVELISDVSRVEQIEAPWKALWSTMPDTSPFQSPDWLLPWLQHYGMGPLLCVAFWHESSLVGIAPMYIYGGDHDGRRRLFLLGTGNSDYLDVVFDPERRLECCRLLIAELERCAELWDECSFQRLPSGSPLLNAFGEHSAFCAKSFEQEPCPVLDLTDSASAPMLKTAHYYLRKIQQQERFSIELATEDSLDELLAHLERLH